MYDREKYIEIYKEIIKLTPEDAIELLLNSDTEDQQFFFEFVVNFLLQRKQKELIANKVF